MRNLNKLASVFSATAMLAMAMASCEGGDLYNIDSPDWIANRVDSIASTKPTGDEDVEGLLEDVYTIGKTDYSSGWWAVFSKYYVIPDGEKWIAQFNLNINPAATNTYKNFALILCNDDERGGANYKEYGAIRFDNQPSGNSEWGDYIDRSCVESSLTFEADTDPGVDKLGGKVTLTIDRSEPGAFTVTMTNGTVTKTYKQKSSIENLNADASNTNIRAFLVPEGSFIDFLGTTIEPIGGLTSREDKLPLSMKLGGVAKKVLVGTPFEEAFANVTAEIQFEQEVTKTVTAADLVFQVVPDMETVGKKTLIAVYNKSYKGELCQPIVGTAEFEVVDKLYSMVGAADNSTGFWGAHSDNIKVAPGETYVSVFTNYTSGANNWNNFVIVLDSEDTTTEYAVVRADNYGWGTGYDACTPSGGQADWGTWLAAMNGAKVTAFITNNGDGTADVKTVMNGTDGETYYQDYIGIGVSDPENFYFRYTVDGSHLEFDQMVGADDNSTAFWGTHSDNFQVPAGTTAHTSFINHTPGTNNWNNFVVVLDSEDTLTEYAVVRADNYGWGDGYASCTPETTVPDWATWLAAMDGAKVDLYVTNHGDGTADVLAIMIGTDGEEYIQSYTGIAVSNPDDFFFRLTVDGSHIVFDITL